MVIGILPSSQHPTYFEPVDQSKGFCERVGDGFVGFFKWMGSWIESGFTSKEEPPAPYQLTPEQKTRIQELYIQSLEALKKLDQPQCDEEVKEFLRMLLEFYQKRSDILKEESQCHYQTYQFNQKKWQDSQEKHRVEFEKMIEESKAKDFWNLLAGAVTPIFTAIAGLALPPGLNVAVVCISIVLAIEELSNHALTNTIAEMARPDGGEDREKLESRLHLATSILEIALAIPVGYYALTSLKVAFGFAKASTSIGKVTTEMAVNKRQGNITTLTHQSKESSRKLTDTLTPLQRAEKDLVRTTDLSNKMIQARRRISPFAQGGG